MTALLSDVSSDALTYNAHFHGALVVVFPETEQRLDLMGNRRKVFAGLLGDLLFLIDALQIYMVSKVGAFRSFTRVLELDMVRRCQRSVPVHG